MESQRLPSRMFPSFFKESKNGNSSQKRRRTRRISSRTKGKKTRPKIKFRMAKEPKTKVKTKKIKIMKNQRIYVNFRVIIITIGVIDPTIRNHTSSRAQPRTLKRMRMERKKVKKATIFKKKAIVIPVTTKLYYGQTVRT